MAKSAATNNENRGTPTSTRASAPLKLTGAPEPQGPYPLPRAIQIWDPAA
jgi:hypothetical protein